MKVEKLRCGGCDTVTTYADGIAEHPMLYSMYKQGWKGLSVRVPYFRHQSTGKIEADLQEAYTKIHDGSLRVI